MGKSLSLILFSLLLVSGQLLFKQAALFLPKENGFSLISSLLSNVWLVAAVILYGGATILWVLILRTTPLSFAYPFVALGFVFVPLFSWLIWNETISWPYLVGVGFILVGIFTIVRTSNVY